VPFYKSVLDAKAGGRGSSIEVDEGLLMPGRGFRYGRHVWPHDGANMEFGSGQTRQETARKLGLYVEIQPRQRDADKHQAARNRFKISSIDEKHCARGIECLFNYQKVWDEKLMMFLPKPKRDWTKHGADSFGYSSLDDRPSRFPYRPGRGSMKEEEEIFADGSWDELAC